MVKNTTQKPEVIEPEILDEKGQVINNPADKARPKGDNGGFFGGLLVLAFGFLMTLLVGIFTVCVILPLMLIGKILGFQIHTFRK